MPSKIKNISWDIYLWEYISWSILFDISKNPKILHFFKYSNIKNIEFIDINNIKNKDWLIKRIKKYMNKHDNYIFILFNFKKMKIKAIINKNYIYNKFNNKMKLKNEKISYSLLSL